MTIRCRRRDDCRLCGSRALELVLQLAPTPPANAFVPASALGQAQERFPLDVFFCRGCGHVQLRDVVDPAALFEHYVYVSGTSPVFVDHFRRYAADAVARWGLAPGDLVVDVGSNDGTLLRFFQEAGLRALGIDPAREIAARATAAGIETLPAFFTGDLAASIRAERGPARLIAANNVFAHADDLGGIADAVRELLAPDGVFAFEVSYLGDVVRDTLFDMTYHEHLAYHALGPLVPFFPRHGLQVIRVERVPTHGGSIRVAAQRAGGPRPVEGSVGAILAEERAQGLDRAETFHAFAAQIERRKRALGALLRDLRAAGRRIAGYGAPAKATTLLYHFELGADVLEYVVDDSPLKQGLYTPGTHIPVVAAAHARAHRPDYLLVLAWNFAASIVERNGWVLDGGGHFLIPLPDVTVV